MANLKPINPANSGDANARATIKVGQENSTSKELYYKDHGSSPLLALISTVGP